MVFVRNDHSTSIAYSLWCMYMVVLWIVDHVCITWQISLSLPPPPSLFLSLLCLCLLISDSIKVLCQAPAVSQGETFVLITPC